VARRGGAAGAPRPERRLRVRDREAGFLGGHGVEALLVVRVLDRDAVHAHEMAPQRLATRVGFGAKQTAEVFDPRVGHEVRLEPPLLPEASITSEKDHDNNIRTTFTIVTRSSSSNFLTFPNQIR